MRRCLRPLTLLVSLSLIWILDPSRSLAAEDLPSEPALTATTQAIDVLFYGSSFTSYNNMPAMFRQLAAVADPAIEVHDQLVARPGYSLDLHWRDELVQHHLQEKAWDVVILQEQAQAPLRKKERMATHAGNFAQVVEGIGGRTLLLMAWAPRRRQAMTEALAKATEDVGQQVGADVSPVGRAWYAALLENPNLGLHSADGVHPAPLGSYFTACVLLTSSIEGFDPRGLPPLDLDIAEEDLELVQRVAWETVRSSRHP